MTYENIARVNGEIRTVDVKGKQYAEVNQRINAFRKLYPEGCIETELISNDNGVCVIKATVKTDGGKVLGTGTAYEKESSSFINKTSYIENCETSAVGRALGMCGIGIDTSIASAEEVSNAILNQGGKKKNAEEHICESCGQAIGPTVSKNGEFIPAEKVIAIAKEKTGKQLCADCTKAAVSK